MLANILDAAATDIRSLLRNWYNLEYSLKLNKLLSQWSEKTQH